MKAEARREQVLDRLRRSDEPISGRTLAQQLGVSRQVIVSDIALLKAGSHNIIATNRGYVLLPDRQALPDAGMIRVIRVCHTTEEIGDELYSIVDAGGRVIDVFVHHEMYGEFRAPLSLSSRQDVDDFVRRLRLGQVEPLKKLTDDVHYHTISAASLPELDRIMEVLKEKGYLADEERRRK